MAVTARYSEVANELRRRIADGVYPPGAKLPSEKELREEFPDDSLGVLRAAVGELRTQGLVETRQGKGTTVRKRKELFRWAGNRYKINQGAPNLAEEKAGGWKHDVTAEHGTQQASPEIAARLQIEPGDMVSQVVYHWYVDGEPVQTSTQWEPLAITRDTPIERPSGGERGSPDVITRFDSIGFHVDQVDEDIRSRMPTPDETRTLRIPPGVPVFEIRRTHHSRVPVETADIISRADRFVIQVREEVRR